MYTIQDGRIIWTNHNGLNSSWELTNAFYQYSEAVDFIEDAFGDETNQYGERYLDHFYKVRNRVLVNILDNRDAANDFDNRSYELTERWLFAVKAAIVAMLHEAVEAGKTDFDYLYSKFDSDIVEAIDYVTLKPGFNYSYCVGRAVHNYLSKIVMISDLEVNLDLTRVHHSLDNNSMDDIMAYHNAYLYIMNINN